MSIKWRCRHCGRYDTLPDYHEAIKSYCASGGMIQVLTERIVAQPIHKHYITPGPFWLASAIAGIPLGFSGALIKYAHIDPDIVFGFIAFCFFTGLVIASTQVEEQEIEESPEANDETEIESTAPTPVRVEEVTHPGKNSVSIRWPHEPPHDDDPDKQRRLYQADLALAKAVTDLDNPLTPISWPKVQKRNMNIGEPTFYRIQHHWYAEGLVFKSSNGAVYLKPSGVKTAY